MRGSLFAKMFLLQAGILAAVVIAIALMASVLYAQRTYAEKRRELDSASGMAAGLMQSWLDGAIDMERLSDEVDLIGYITDSRIHLVRYDRESLERVAAQFAGRAGGEAQGADGQEADVQDADAQLVSDMGRILDGETIFHNRVHSDGLGMDVVRAGYPLTSRSRIIGGILIHAPVSRMDEELAHIHAIIAWMAGGALAAGTLLILQLARRITKPIRQMQLAAAEVASGNAAEPIPVRTSDEIGRLAHAFNHMQTQLMRTEEIRRDFINHVSHELRTPLTSIRGFVCAMRDGIVPREAWDETLKRIGDESDRLVRLTTEILDLTRLQSGTLPLMQERISLNALAVETVGRMQGLAAEKHQCLSVAELQDGEQTGSGMDGSVVSGRDTFDVSAGNDRSAADRDMQIYVDPDRIRQVLVNLIGNAVKFTPVGGRVTVSLSLDMNRAVIRVSDTGPGVDPKDLERIFDPFHRVEKSGNPALGGSGLGLHIARVIVEMHKGEIAAAQNDDGGLEVTVRLPLD